MHVHFLKVLSATGKESSFHVCERILICLNTLNQLQQ